MALIVALTVCYVCKKKSSGPFVLQAVAAKAVPEGIAMNSAVAGTNEGMDEVI